MILRLFPLPPDRVKLSLSSGPLGQRNPGRGNKEQAFQGLPGSVSGWPLDMRPCLLQSEPFAAESVGCYQLNRMSVVFGAVLMLSKLCLKPQPSADSLGVSQQPWGSLYGQGRPSNGALACEQAPSPVLLLASVPALSELPPFKAWKE